MQWGKLFYWRDRDWFDARYSAEARLERTDRIVVPWPLVVRELVAWRWLPFWFGPIVWFCRLAILCGLFRVKSLEEPKRHSSLVTIGQYDIDPIEDEIPF